MDTSFERSPNTTDEWYTPKTIIDALGHFDLDPCAPCNRLCMGHSYTAYYSNGRRIKSRLGRQARVAKPTIFTPTR